MSSSFIIPEVVLLLVVRLTVSEGRRGAAPVRGKFTECKMRALTVTAGVCPDLPTGVRDHGVTVLH